MGEREPSNVRCAVNQRRLDAAHHDLKRVRDEVGDVRTLRGVALDIGGVLLSWAYGKYRQHPDDWPPALADAAWEARLGLEPGEFARRVWAAPSHAYATSGAIRFEDYWPQVGQELGIDTDELAELWEDYWVISCLDQEVETAVRSLRPRYRVVALSNAFSNAREEVTRRFGLDDLVEFMVISGEVGVAKPDPRIYEIMLSTLSLEPHEVLYVDDVEANVQAARDLGIRATRSDSTSSFLRVLDLLR